MCRSDAANLIAFRDGSIVIASDSSCVPADPVLPGKGFHEVAQTDPPFAFSGRSTAYLVSRFVAAANGSAVVGAGNITIVVPCDTA